MAHDDGSFATKIDNMFSDLDALIPKIASIRFATLSQDDWQRVLKVLDEVEAAMDDLDDSFSRLA
jgi:hypothetical protein